MTNSEIKLRVLKEALVACLERKETVPSQLKPIYESIETQLQFVVDYIKGEHKDHARLHELNFGWLAVREIEESDPKLANLLKSAFYVANQVAKGLKLDDGFIKQYI